MKQAHAHIWGTYHVDELRLIGRRHDDHVRQRCHVRHVKCTAVRCAISAYQPATVHGKAHCVATFS